MTRATSWCDDGHFLGGSPGSAGSSGFGLGGGGCGDGFGFNGGSPGNAFGSFDMVTSFLFIIVARTEPNVSRNEIDHGR